MVGSLIDDARGVRDDLLEEKGTVSHWTSDQDSNTLKDRPIENPVLFFECLKTVMRSFSHFLLLYV